MSDQFVREQRRDLMKLNSLINLAEEGQVARFNNFVEHHLGDDFFKQKVTALKSTAGEIYQKDLHVRAFKEEFRERPNGNLTERWNVTSRGVVPDWIIKGNWSDQEFYKQYVSKVLTLEAEQKERNILQASRQTIGLSR
jgi:hypothetical protein